ncbi:hypothetical protein JQ557_16780 [Bradyrhizobium sp. U87765 SZCCT0131]|uniref:hypothetical protein n=1 Tax=unclassified Bradyrhizobium TaxID=2631580 RepID=UPI001BAC35A5|nr:MULTISPECIES: hypothetical protein [unclassified Bradyrhizobium]MBR1219664.1 hypothetical protein [Bradyrhizobium sp. U87765 SZCCT0131]MBR1262315.1 hypothetical protein [Bradyrhizobium sp. U87765 SZCCT0134]MBR1308502.1 hypothetical protein [Bradyrhizobium sp. U87765 SZCCT0110]MBR1318097.1 hypothetical protein [Bradyrhizobium sp. U87765 SZCCT0109]MBR1351800.1 hypothetical protein [Bradyrhizobium sp. U87765 SZCCT0048]
MGEYEERFGREFDRFLLQGGLGAAKAVVIAVMMFISIDLMTGNIAKAFWVAVLCAVISLFRTWRRYLEPISFVLLCIAVAGWLDFRWDGVRVAIASLKAALSSSF